jgi:signal transduction histidine kinase
MSGYRRRMRFPRAGGVEAVLAAGCAGWAAFFLAAEGTGPLLTGPLTFLAVLAHRRRPLVAALGVFAIDVLLALLGVPSENPGPLAAWLVVAYALGRYAGWRASGVALAVFLAVVVATTDPADPRMGTVVFAGVLFATPWMFGRLVRRRTEDARRAAAEASELALVDPAARAAQVVAEERARLAADVLRVVRSGVEVMQRHARDAEEGVDPAALTGVQEQGRRALTELRRLLGLLRADEPAPDPAASPTSAAVWRVDVALATGLGLLLVVEQVVVPGPVHPLGVVLGVGFVGAVGLRRVDPMLACVVGLVPVALAAGLGQALPYGLVTAAALLLLAWSVAVEGRWR